MLIFCARMSWNATVSLRLINQRRFFSSNLTFTGDSAKKQKWETRSKKQLCLLSRIHFILFTHIYCHRKGYHLFLQHKLHVVLFTFQCCVICHVSFCEKISHQFCVLVTEITWKADVQKWPFIRDQVEWWDTVATHVIDQALIFWATVLDFVCFSLFRFWLWQWNIVADVFHFTESDTSMLGLVLQSDLRCHIMFITVSYFYWLA